VISKIKTIVIYVAGGLFVSALWERVFSPLLTWLQKTTVSIISSNSIRYENSFYSELALGNVGLHSAFTSDAVFAIIIFIAFYAGREKIQKELQNPLGKIDKYINVFFNYAIIIMFYILLFFLYSNYSRLNEQIKILHDYNRLKSYASDYMPPEKMRFVDSGFSFIQNKKDYERCVEMLNKYVIAGLEAQKELTNSKINAVPVDDVAKP